MSCRRLIAALALVLGTIAVAQAHTRLLRSDPADGSVHEEPVRTVRLWFSEAVEGSRDAVRVTGPAGTRVDRGNGRVAADDATRFEVDADATAAGEYRVEWRVVSADGHPVGGAFTFTVETGDDATASPGALADPGADDPHAGHAVSQESEPAPATGRGERLGVAGGAAGRWLHLLGVALAVGPVVLMLLLGAGGTAARPAAEPAGATLPAAFPWPGVALGAVVLLAAAAVLLLNQMAALGAGAGEILPGRWGLLWQVRVGAALLLLWLALDGWMRRGGATAAARWRVSAALLAAALLVVATSMSGHAATTPPVPLSVTIDAVHLAAMSVWIGGLAAFVLLLLPALRRSPESEQAALLGRVVPRFSAVALPCVLLLVATGLWQTWRLVGSPELLVGTAYGRTLLVKLGLVALLLTPAAVNRFVVKPRLRSASTAAGGARMFRRLIGAEAAVGAAVLAATALLTGLPPARGEAAALPLAGFEFSPPLDSPPIDLPHGEDGRFDLAAERGNAVLVFFGFTNCPDYCPLTLREWRRIRELLGDEAAARTRFVFISVDTDRDTPRVAADYARSFHPEFIGLAPDAAELERIESSFFVRSMTVDGEVMHSTRYFLVEPRGGVRVMYAHDARVEDVARDVTRVVARSLR